MSRLCECSKIIDMSSLKKKLAHIMVICDHCQDYQIASQDVLHHGNRSAENESSSLIGHALDAAHGLTDPSFVVRTTE